MPGRFPRIALRLSGLHDWPCPPFGGLFYARRFPRIAVPVPEAAQCACPGYMTGLALLLEGFLCLAFSPDRAALIRAT